MSSTDSEIEFLRASEDLFSTLRGVPHTLSPKDIHLARKLWNEGVSLVAISAGVSEIMDRKKQAGDTEPVVSLSYCRHAIRRNAKRLAEQKIGSREGSSTVAVATPGTSTAPLVESLNAVVTEQGRLRPMVAEVVAQVLRELVAASDSEPAALESFIFDLEAALLESCWSALDASDQLSLNDAAARAADASGATGEALERTCQAFRDRELRKLLNLPRLELL